jgi:zinc transport system substrate-binding protein
VFHPSWGYFAAEFGLTQVPIEFEGKEPSPRALKFCIDYARKNGIKTVFVQPQFSQSSATVLAGEIGGVTRVADDLAYDWARNLRAAGTAFINEK